MILDLIFLGSKQIKYLRMALELVKILPLPTDVAAQIKSSTTIPSLASVVLGLVENSLDAGSRRIEINVDFRRGSCTVEDDGIGVAPEEFEESGGLGKSCCMSCERSHGDNSNYFNFI